jgi:hypothetical protein
VTDLSTVLLAIGPAAVTGLVAFHAARIQTTVAERGIRARPGELEHQVRDKRRDERAAAYARYLETGLELHYILNSWSFSKAWHDEERVNRNGPARAQLILLGSADVVAAMDALETDVLSLLASMNDRLTPGIDVGSVAYDAYHERAEEIRLLRRTLEGAMRSDVL